MQRTERVGDLLVSAYVAECPRGHWMSRQMPVAECAYYGCLAENDRAVFDEYVGAALRRHEDWGKGDHYEDHLKLCEAIRREGFDPGKGQPMTVWAGTRLLKEGHHRAAILLHLRGPEHEVVVQEESGEPSDVNPRCGNPCGPGGGH